MPDGLNAARGILRGCLWGTLAWALILFVIVMT